jgi:hypothetical protein
MDIQTEIDTLARRFTGDGVSYSQALSRVFQEHPELYRRYRESVPSANGVTLTSQPAAPPQPPATPRQASAPPALIRGPAVPIRASDRPRSRSWIGECARWGV